MDLPQIRINSTSGQIGLNITKPVQRIDQEAATMHMEQPNAEMRIRRTPGRLTIDQSEAWADMDLKNVFRRIDEFAQKGMQDALTAMAVASQQGDQLMKIENGGNPIVDQAVENSKSAQFEFNIGWIPSPFSVKMHYQPGKLDINWQVHKPKINVQTHRPVHDYTPGKVSGYMLRQPSLEIDFVGGNVNQKL